MKILIISLAGVGDTLMMTPLLHELRKNYPKSKIDVLVMWGSSKGILKGNPNVNEIIHFNMVKEGFFKTWKFCNELKKREYDISINTYPQSKIQYRIVAKLVNAKRRLSHRYGNWSFLDNLMINEKVEEDYNVHCVENNLNLLKVFGKMKKMKKHEYEIYFSKEEEKIASDFIRKNNLENKILIGFHVGSSSTKNLALRRWPIENYVELAGKLIKFDNKVRILLFGSNEEEKENLMIKESNKDKVIIVSESDIKNSAAVVKKCDVFLSVDTALMHIASAAGVKNQIAIETPTFNKTVYPYGGNFKLVKNKGIEKDLLEYYKYDGKPIKASGEELRKIMKSVKVEEVFNEIKKNI